MTTETNQETEQNFYRITISPDYGTENPLEWDISPFELVSFSTRHINFEHPDTVLACHYMYPDEDSGEPEAWQCEELPNHPEHTIDEKGGHKYVPDPLIAATLSYYEHGLCRWSRQGNGPIDPRGWDTVSVAGVLRFKDWDEKFNWDGKGTNPFRFAPDDPGATHTREEVIDFYLDEYTDWANGSVYHVTIEEKLTPDPCPCCGQNRRDEWEMVDSCGGIIGTSGLDDYLADTEVRVGTDEEQPHEIVEVWK